MKNYDHEPKRAPAAKAVKKPYAKPRLARHGDIVEQTTRGHKGTDKNRASLGL